MNRLFTFGSCFTKWNWPTWADIIGTNFNEYYNWGRAYLGNQFIYHSIVEAHLKHRFTKDDTIIVMWSNFGRTDQYRDNKWTGYLTSIDNLNDVRGCMLQDLSSMYLVMQLLESIGCDWNFCSIVDFPNTVSNDHGPFGTPNVDFDEVADIVENYKELLDVFLPSVHNIVFDYNWHSKAFLDPTNTLSNNNEWVKLSYNRCKGEDWPTFEDYMNKNTKQIDHNILEEIQIHDTKLKWTASANPRFDYHPTPMEWLGYVQTVFPAYTITKATSRKLSHLEKCLRTHGSMDPDDVKFFKRILPDLW